MAKPSNGFNLSAAIRNFRKGHRGVSANDALAAVKKSHPGQKINEGPFGPRFTSLPAMGNEKSQ